VTFLNIYGDHLKAKVTGQNNDMNCYDEESVQMFRTNSVERDVYLNIVEGYMAA